MITVACQSLNFSLRRWLVSTEHAWIWTTCSHASRDAHRRRGGCSHAHMEFLKREAVKNAIETDPSLQGRVGAAIQAWEGPGTPTTAEDRLRMLGIHPMSAQSGMKPSSTLHLSVCGCG